MSISSDSQLDLRAPTSLTADEALTDPDDKPSCIDRSITTAIRTERQELKEAAEQSKNVILDLSLDGVVRWVSQSWKDVVGLDPAMTKGRKMVEIIDEPEDLFGNAIDAMRQDDTRSHIVRFGIKLGRVLNKPTGPETEVQTNEVGVAEDREVESIMLEAQGIMVYDRSTGAQSHVSTGKLSDVNDLTNLRVLCRPCGCSGHSRGRRSLSTCLNYW